MISTDLAFGERIVHDITYSTVRSKFIAYISNSSVSDRTLRGNLFESIDGKVWTEASGLGNLPMNPNGISSVSLREFNGEIFASYVIDDDGNNNNVQYTSLVITRAENGQWLPYADLIDKQASFRTTTTIFFVDGNIVVISNPRGMPLPGDCNNCGNDIAKMYTSSGVNIVAPSLPSLSSPADQTIFNNQSLAITWSVTGGEMGHQFLYRNGIVEPMNFNTDWEKWHYGEDIEFSTTTRLDVGTYNYSLHVFDLSGNEVVDWVIITVEQAPLSITHPADEEIFIGNSPPSSVYWYIYGGLPGNYYLYRNASLIELGTWSYTYGHWLQLNDAPLTIAGLYNYTLFVNDTSGESISDTVFINVREKMALSISSPSDETYTTNDIFTISWTVYGEGGNSYAISSNASYTLDPSSGPWQNGDVITTVDGPLSLGTYNYTIYVFNTTGSGVTDSVIITIVPGPPLSLSNPIDIGYYPVEIFDIAWTVAGGTTSGNYVIFKNDTQFATGNWVEGDRIQITEGPLSTGVYNFTLQVFDTGGASLSDSIIISIFDLPIPTVSVPTELYVRSSEPFTIFWLVEGSLSGMYQIYKDHQLFMNGSWQIGDTIVATDGPLDVGIYNYTIFIIDSFGTSGSFTTIVTVADDSPRTTPTSTTSTSTNNTTEGGNGSDDGFLPGFTFVSIVISFMIVLSLHIKKKEYL